jgi:hypothetical protein
MEEAIQVKWPKGHGKYLLQVKAAADKILSGFLLALDPSSGGKGSAPGYAIFHAGELQSSGEIYLPYKVAYERLNSLFDELKKLVPDPPDVCCIEEIRGVGKFAPIQLVWSVGVSMVAVRSPILIETPILQWRALAAVTPEYKKDNAADAIMIGKAVILRARDFKNGNYDLSTLRDSDQ